MVVEEKEEEWWIERNTEEEKEWWIERNMAKEEWCREEHRRGGDDGSPDGLVMGQVV